MNNSIELKIDAIIFLKKNEVVKDVVFKEKRKYYKSTRGRRHATKSC
jgi:hypothetical protein